MSEKVDRLFALMAEAERRMDIRNAERRAAQRASDEADEAYRVASLAWANARNAERRVAAAST